MAKKKRTDAAADLAEMLVRVLESQRALGAPHYPLSLERLAELTAPQATPAQVLSAARKTAFKKRALVAKSSGKLEPKKAVQAPVALLDDVERLAETPQTLEFVLRHKRTSTIHAHTVSQLGDFLAAKLKKPFKQAVARRLQAGDLPPTVAYVKDRVEKLFFVADLQPESLRTRLLAAAAVATLPGSRPGVEAAAAVARADSPQSTAAPPIAPSATDGAPADFAARFEQAFDQLDGARGAHNFVSLVDLRRALADCTRGQFDAGLRQLRADGRYGLSAAESVHGIRPEERDAAVEEAGAVLLHVSRRHR